MATFFMFGKYSADALKEVSAERTKKAAALVKQFGGEVESAYALLGEHDLVLIVELPDIDQAIKTSVALSKLTRIAFSTSPAVTVKAFDKLMKKA